MFRKIFLLNFVRGYAVKMTSKITTNITKPRPAERWFDNVPLARSNVTERLLKLCENDTHPHTIDCISDTYRNEAGIISVLPTVREAERNIFKEPLDMDYLPSDGMPAFNCSAAKLIFGKNAAVLEEQRVVTAQTLGGSGALSIIGTLIGHYFEGNRLLYLPYPSWPDHALILQNYGRICYYRYYNEHSKTLDFVGMLNDFRKMPEHSIVLLQVCGHNPTGFDPSGEQWLELATIVKQRKLLPILDVAYQGLASGDLAKDARPVRQFLQSGNKVAVTQSFSKNMGVYGERIGALHIVCESKNKAQRLRTLIKKVIEATCSAGTLHGGRLVAQILNDVLLRNAWRDEVHNMANRLKRLRHDLRAELEQRGAQVCWEHLTAQNGMYCFTGLKRDQIARLITEFHIYLTPNGRLVVPALTKNNIAYVASAINHVTN